MFSNHRGGRLVRGQALRPGVLKDQELQVALLQELDGDELSTFDSGEKVEGLLVTDGILSAVVRNALQTTRLPCVLARMPSECHQLRR